MDDMEETYSLTEDGIKTVIMIDELFRTTDYDLDRIAFEVGLSCALDVRVLYAMGELTGVLDFIHNNADKD